MNNSDRDKNISGAKVPLEKPDPQVAKRPPAPGAWHERGLGYETGPF